MALHRLLEIEIGVPDPATLNAFYQEIGFVGGEGGWGGAELPGQIRIGEAPYRQLRRVRVGCEGEEDLSATAKRLDALGVAYQQGGGRLTLRDPVNEWEYVVEPADAFDVAAQPLRTMNHPGMRARLGERAEVIVEKSPRPPRRLGHLVVGSPKPVETIQLLTEGLGFRISDKIGGGIFWYMLDPSGTFFEYFADMDQIVDEDAWQPRDDWDPADSWSVWGEKDQPEVFFRPNDMQAIIDGWAKTHA